MMVISVLVAILCCLIALIRLKVEDRQAKEAQSDQNRHTDDISIPTASPIDYIMAIQSADFTKSKPSG
jgi:hypothetical protein